MCMWICSLDGREHPLIVVQKTKLLLLMLGTREIMFLCWSWKLENIYRGTCPCSLNYLIANRFLGIECVSIFVKTVFSTYFSLLYSFFWVIPRRLNFMCRRFGTLFHLHRWCKQDESTCSHHLWIWNRQIIPKRRHVKFRRRGITR